MNLYSVQKASELGPEELGMFERMLGRKLAVDETISVNTWQPHEEPSRELRESLRREIMALAQEVGERGGDISHDEYEALIEEAFAATRGNIG